MQVIELSAAHSASAVVDALIPSLIAEVGTPRFETSLTQLASRTIGCRQVTAFSWRKDGTLVPVGLFASERRDAVRAAAGRYIDLHWRRDRTNALRDHRGTNVGLAAVMGREDVDDSGFRHDCYSEPGVGYRLSLLTRQRDTLMKISFHRPLGEGLFPEIAIQALLGKAPLIGALVQRHGELTATSAPPTFEQTHFESLLASKCANLTSRERTVCSMIALGMSSEAISLTLGISINTVLTFRRRAYSRLNISTQNELMRLLFSGGETVWN